MKTFWHSCSGLNQYMVYVINQSTRKNISIDITSSSILRHHKYHVIINTTSLSITRHHQYNITFILRHHQYHVIINIVPSINISILINTTPLNTTPLNTTPVNTTPLLHRTFIARGGGEEGCGEKRVPAELFPSVEEILRIHRSTSSKF